MTQRAELTFEQRIARAKLLRAKRSTDELRNRLRAEDEQEEAS